MANFDDLIAKIESLTAMELAELVKKLEEKFGISAAAPVAAGAGAGAAAAEEKTSFTVVLKSGGANKLNAIKAVREVTTLGIEGGEGPRGRRAEDSEGEREEGGSGRDEEETGSGWSDGGIAIRYYRGVAPDGSGTPCVFSSVAERPVHIGKVVGPIPTRRTSAASTQRGLEGVLGRAPSKPLCVRAAFD